MINILYLLLSVGLISVGLEIGVKKGSPLIHEHNNWDYLAYAMLWGGIVFWVVFLCKFLLWIFT